MQIQEKDFEKSLPVQERPKHGLKTLQVKADWGYDKKEIRIY